MAAQLCQVPASLDAESAQTDCHGRSVDADADAKADRTGVDSACCAASDLVPDLGKLPLLAPLPVVWDYPLDAQRLSGSCFADGFALARDGPDLARLCRLLI